jgi:hypothetical protein
LEQIYLYFNDYSKFALLSESSVKQLPFFIWWWDGTNSFEDVKEKRLTRTTLTDLFLKLDGVKKTNKNKQK